MENFLNKIKQNYNITTAITVVVVLFFIVACSNDKPEKIAAVTDRAAMPQLHATDITTYISDSGVTRYRIYAQQWDVYDKATRPYWDFPKGIHLEKFDENLNVDANIHSKYARFDENEQIWELKGDVKSTNLQGELFETEQLFWNQRQEKFYTDSLVKITQKTRITTGTGFESDQSMTFYQFRKIQMILVINDKDSI